MNLHHLSVVAACTLLSTSAFAGDSGEHAWGYDCKTGPAHWGDISETCSSGQIQSPIAIPASSVTPAPLTGIDLSFGKAKLSVTDNGHTVVAAVDGDAGFKLGDAFYKLAQFHFHAGSENTLDHANHRFPMEMHMVHVHDSGTPDDASDDKLAVIGVFIEVGTDANAELAKVLGHLPEGGAHPEAVDAKIDLAALLPDLSGWNFPGSLTTPGCSERVQRFVLSNTINATQDQVWSFMEHHPNNYRPPQPLNGRVVVGGTPAAFSAFPTPEKAPRKPVCGDFVQGAWPATGHLLAVPKTDGPLRAKKKAPGALFKGKTQWGGEACGGWCEQTEAGPLCRK